MDLLNMWNSSPSSARKVYEKCSRSVVKIDIARGCGAGFVWDRDCRLVVTCHHVIADASSIRVTFEDKTSFSAEVVFSAEECDVAVLLVDAPKDKLWPIIAGDSDIVHVGDSVYAIGTPFGYQNSLSTGVISRVKHTIRLLGISPSPIEGAFQIDAALNPGSSGGPLFDMNGRVIGMNAAIEPSISHTNNGVGFTIPVNIVKEVVGIARNCPIESLPNESDAYCIEVPNFENGECSGVSGGVHMPVSSTYDTRPSSGTEFSRNHPSHVKQEHYDHYRHKDKNVIGTTTSRGGPFDSSDSDSDNDDSENYSYSVHTTFQQSVNGMRVHHHVRFRNTPMNNNNEANDDDRI